MSRLLGTAPSTAAASSPAAASADASSSIRDEYITNLQQQIYFLELENNLLKKSGAAGGSGGGKGAGPSLDIDPSGPLETHLSTLRSKYTDLEGQYKQEVEVGFAFLFAAGLSGFVLVLIDVWMGCLF